MTRLAWRIGLLVPDALKYYEVGLSDEEAEAYSIGVREGARVLEGQQEQLREALAGVMGFAPSKRQWDAARAALAASPEPAATERHAYGPGDFSRPVEHSSKAVAVAETEQRLENDQVRRMQQTGRCPTCGADA